MSNPPSPNSEVDSHSQQASSVEGQSAPVKKAVDRFIGRFLLRSILLVVTAATLLDIYQWRYGELNIFEPRGEASKPIPLAMDGGDPYLRALMRTISASESNVPRPYSVIYGGDYFRGWNQHPDDCVYIPVGPNTGNCSTAAGRYQFITTTWEEQARKYHPDQPKVLFWRPYPFDPTSQDVVLHRWLADNYEWGVDLSKLLREGQVERVLEILSPTWTSLGYGIETNSMSAYLPNIYWEMLDEELTAIAPVDPAVVQPATTGGVEADELEPDEFEPGEPVQTYAEDWDSEVTDEPGEAESTVADGAAAEAGTLKDGLAEIAGGSRKLLDALFGR